MKISIPVLAAVALLHLLAFAPGPAADAADTGAAAKAVPAYKPPMRGAPASRIGGGTRGAPGTGPLLVVLAPDHTGLTTREQPALYWYVSQPVATRLEVTVINAENVDPLVEKQVQPPAKPGIQRLRLADLGVHLKPGIEYRWFVSLVPDAAQRSGDVLASGTIQRVAPSAELTRKVEAAGERGRHLVYAEEGIWYDAIDSLSEQLARSPDDADLRAQRAALLEQVGLPEVAADGR